MRITLYFKSLINRFFFAIRNKLRLSRRNYREKPAIKLTDLASEQISRIEQLQQKYKIIFETEFDAINSLENYHLLDILDRTPQHINWHPAPHKKIVDVGSRSFAYAPVLQKYLSPRELTGIEIDAFRIYSNLHTRASYAEYYLRNSPNTDFQPMSFLGHKSTPDGLLFLYPFVIPEPLIYWALPLAQFLPEKIFKHAFSQLQPGGWLYMINHGYEEASAAEMYAIKSGFKMLGRFGAIRTILPRLKTPVVSVWMK